MITATEYIKVTIVTPSVTNRHIPITPPYYVGGLMGCVIGNYSVGGLIGGRWGWKDE